VSLGPASNFIDTHGRVRIWILIAQRVPILSIALSNQGDHFYQADLARRQVTNFVWARLVVLIAVASVWVWSILHRLVHVNALSVPAVALVRRLADVHEWSCLLQSVRLRLSRNLELFSGLLGRLELRFKGVIVGIFCTIDISVLNLYNNTARTFSARVKFEGGGSLVVPDTHLWPFLWVTGFRWEWIFLGRAWSRLLAIIIVELYVIQFWIRWGSRARCLVALLTIVHCAINSVWKYLFIIEQTKRLS